jgi:hypothetical protein
MVLDAWLGKEGIAWLAERDNRTLIGCSATSGGDIGRLEATGAQNFIDLDDMPVTEGGEPVHPKSVIRGGELRASGRRWFHRSGQANCVRVR